jgi:hypothetical protein
MWSKTEKVKDVEGNLKVSFRGKKFVCSSEHDDL